MAADETSSPGAAPVDGDAPALGRRRSAREISTPSVLERILASGTSLRDLRLQDLDLRPVCDALLSREDLAGLVVLGGTVPHRLMAHLRRHGALVFPADPRVPVDVYRARLYQPEELYAGLADGYAATPDAEAYAWTRDASLDGDIYPTLLRAIHDDSIGDALEEVLRGRDVVGIMGGHAVRRDEPTYAVTAHLGQSLADAGQVVVTGGGPGAMEAANLGAFAPMRGPLDAALEELTSVPSFLPDVTRWAAHAMRVRDQLRTGRQAGAPARSIGIPTWFYGHEPPNVFCDGVAKYFSNALREEGLLARCTTGIIVMPGEAGTVQEVFQAVTPLYYADADRPLPHLALVGRRHWTRTVPLWDAVRAMSRGRSMEHVVHLVDDPVEALDVLGLA